MLKKSVLLVLFLLNISLFATELSSYEALAQNFEAGQGITVVIKNKYCEIYDQNPVKIPLSIIVTTPDVVVMDENLLAFDTKLFAHGRPPLPKGGLLQRASFYLTKYGDIRLMISFFDGETNIRSDSFDDVMIECQLGEGVHIYSS